MKNSRKIIPKLVQNPSEIDQKRSQIDKNTSFDVFGAKPRLGPPQDGPPNLGYSTFGAFLAENDAPRVDLSCLRQIPAPGPRKVRCERKLAFHGGAVSHVRVFFELDVKKNRKSRKQV